MEKNNFSIWMAGFWEGEGSLYKRKNSTGYVIAISQSICPERNVEKTMEKIKNIYRGKIYKIKDNNKHHKRALIWKMGKREDVIYFLKTIFPYCQNRKQEVKNALIHYKNHSRNKYYNFKIAEKFRHEGKSYKEIQKILSTNAWRLLNNNNRLFALLYQIELL